MPTVSRKKLRTADQLPDLAAGHLQGPVRTVTQRTDHLLSLVRLIEADAGAGAKAVLGQSARGRRRHPGGAVPGPRGPGARGPPGARRSPARTRVFA